MVLIPILLAKFKVITFNDLSVMITLIGIIVTVHNTFISCGLFNGGIFMIILFEAVGLGTTGVTKQIVNDFGFVVSVEEIRIFVPRGSNPQHPAIKRVVLAALF